MHNIASPNSLLQNTPSPSRFTGPRRNNLTKSNAVFRAASRNADAALIRRAFDGPTQSAISEKGSQTLGVSQRQIVNWLQGVNDMPSWAIKAVLYYVQCVESAAERIEGRHE